jgi:hypothetical protein
MVQHLRRLDERGMAGEFLIHEQAYPFRVASALGLDAEWVARLARAAPEKRAMCCLQRGFLARAESRRPRSPSCHCLCVATPTPPRRAQVTRAPHPNAPTAPATAAGGGTAPTRCRKPHTGERGAPFAASRARRHADCGDATPLRQPCCGSPVGPLWRPTGPGGAGARMPRRTRGKRRLTP